MFAVPYIRGVFPQEVVCSGSHNLKVGRRGYHTLILLIGVVHWVYEFWGGHGRVECMRVMVSGVVINSAGAVKVIEGGKNIISDGLCWVSVKFLVSGGVS